MRLGRMLLPAAVALLAVGCTAKPVAETSNATGPNAAGPTAASTPGYSGPAVITESALPTEDSDDSGTADPSSSSPASGPVRSSAPAAVDPKAATAGLADCGLPYLRVTVRAAVARSAHASYLVSFTNTGQVACKLTGYPAVAVLSAAGKQVQRATPTPSGYLGGVPGTPATVLVGPGQPATALLEGEQVGLDGNRCPARPGLLITPPHSTVPARLPVATSICGGLQIHPVVGGSL